MFFNHADSEFWLGASSCDHYVDFRTIGAELSLRERGVASTRVIPLTTDLARVPDIRASLGIPRRATLSLFLSSIWKAMTDPGFCFFRAVSHILEKHPHHYHLFLTVPPEPETLAGLMPMERDAARRFMITGPYADLRPFYSSSDFLVETFPVVGGTVRVEAMAMGLPVVAFSHPEQPLYSSTDALGPDYPYTASSEEDVERIASFFIEDAAARQACGSRLRERFRDTASPPLVRAELLRLLEEVAA
ncbi:MAG: glycosyltransferase family 4 protein [Actinobacteria bacterium]|nr:glycosyltransferase family 4 protein [Actinomycetota bacterium]